MEAKFLFAFARRNDSSHLLFKIGTGIKAHGSDKQKTSGIYMVTPEIEEMCDKVKATAQLFQFTLKKSEIVSLLLTHSG